MWRKLREDGRIRRIGLALGVYVLATGVYFAFAARQTLVSHTPFNHFALLAEAWLKGHLDLGGPPPAYAQNNDFAEFKGKWFVVFPPFPALLILPLVKLAHSAERMRDGQFFIWLAGIGPAALVLVLEKLRRMGLTGRGPAESVTLAVCFAFGTVYFFTAEQGTVWFAAHVVAVALAAFYVLFALDAERPLLAGIMLGLGFMTRPPLLYAAPLFLLEALRVSASREATGEPIRAEGVIGRVRALFELGKSVDKRRFFTRCLWFAVPIVLVLAVAMSYNRARFGAPFEFGYRYLTVVWRPRMEKWGLFNYHFLGKNLAVLVASLPWIPKPPNTGPFQINAHGLALWFTTPLYLWLLWPRRVTRLHFALIVSVLLCAVPTLFYQNTGWVQFGYRFSNDYAILLFCLFAIGGYRRGTLFWLAAIFAIVVNGFGAMSFGRPNFSRFYFQDGSQTTLVQPD
jgi:hypothetical protein